MTTTDASKTVHCPNCLAVLAFPNDGQPRDTPWLCSYCGTTFDPEHPPAYLADLPDVNLCPMCSENGLAVSLPTVAPGLLQCPTCNDTHTIHDLLGPAL